MQQLTSRAVNQRGMEAGMCHLPAVAAVEAGGAGGLGGRAAGADPALICTVPLTQSLLVSHL